MFLASRRRQTSCSREWSSDVCSSDLELARKALAQLVGDGRRRGGRGPGRAHPAPDDERDPEPAHQDGGEGRHPREPVEAAEGRRGKHLLAVAGAEGGEDRLPVLAAREALGNLLLHRLARRALEVVAAVNGEPAAALAGERFLDLPLGRRDGGRREEERREGEDRAAHSAGTCARPSSYATARRSAADGHIVTSVPPAMMKPAIQSHDTSGFTKACSVTSPEGGS